MNEEKITPPEKKHKVLDHPILGYFILALFGMILSNLIGPLIDMPIGKAIPEYMSTVEFMGTKQQTAAGVGVGIAAVIAALIFTRMFRPKYRGFLTYAGLSAGLFLVFPFVVMHVTGSIVSMCIVGIGDTFIALLKCFAPGFSEEIIFRGMGVANYMRTIKDEKQITVIFWLSSIVFGFSHMFNAVAGAPFFTSLLQSVYAMGLGMLFAAVYLKSGSLWPSIIAHCIIDYFELCRRDLSESSGLMTGMTAGDWITIVVGLIAGVYAIYLIRKSERPAIMKEWNDRWTQVAVKKDRKAKKA